MKGEGELWSEIAEGRMESFIFTVILGNSIWTLRASTVPLTPLTALTQFPGYSPRESLILEQGKNMENRVNAVNGVNLPPLARIIHVS